MILLDKIYGVYLLDDDNFDFPTLPMMIDDLVAIGGDFHPQRVLNAYENVAGFVGKCGKNVAIKKPLLQVADLYKEFWWR